MDSCMHSRLELHIEESVQTSVSKGGNRVSGLRDLVLRVAPTQPLLIPRATIRISTPMIVPFSIAAFCCSLIDCGQLLSG
jgi:hypothetical protein